MRRVRKSENLSADAESAVHFWVVRAASVSDTVLAGLLGFLHAEEKAVIFRRRRYEDRRNSILAHAIARVGLSAVFGIAPGKWRFSVESSGNPFALVKDNGRRVDLSITHCGAWVAVAASSDCKVGIDLEAVDDLYNPVFFGGSLSPGELGRIQRLDKFCQNDTFTRIWTMKEAFSKAMGVGLHIGFENLTVCFEPKLSVTYSSHLDNPDITWHFMQEKIKPNLWLGGAAASSSVRHVKYVRHELALDDFRNPADFVRP